MKAKISRSMVVLATAMLIGLSGCATTGPQLEEVMEMARKAQSDAMAARDAANAATRTAQDAQRAAAAAQSAAQSAQSAAGQANSCCLTNSEKLERMFKESMRK